MMMKRITDDMIKEESHGLLHFKSRERKKPGSRNPMKKENINFNRVKSSKMHVLDDN